ncbi:hypothetical protein H4R18_003160 [Coemansia javaensis]|uniref:Uncharacterized protein n=1 Tax=Coemansia javaensis TaxID=2761396 RepID=A0A9W8HB69_9FUNG|nr:hypothetical protein H4R18_003160 [Coemansia javaensis]
MTAPPLPHPACDAVYELTPADGNATSRTNLQFVLFYETGGECPRARVGAAMRQAFYETLARYPILYGRIELAEAADGATARVVVRRDALDACMPRYDEVAVEERVADIRRARYGWDAWPPALLRVCVVRRPDTEAPLVQCVVTWHPDGVGLLFSVDHSVADGVGVDILLNQWARAVRSPAAAPDVEPDFDHVALFDDLRRGQQPDDSDWFVRYVDAVDLEQKRGHHPTGAILNSDPRTPQEVERALRADVRAVRVTPDALRRLQEDAHSESGGGGRHIPAIRLAYALFWQRYTAALRAAAPERQGDCLLNVVHSARHLVGRPHYIGNAVCPVYMQLAAEELAAQPLWRIAERVGERMHSVSRAQWLATTLLMQDPRRFAKLLTVFGSPANCQLTVSNISRLRFFDADFGFGAPVHATLYPMLIPGFATWMPLGPDGGLHILWNLPAPVAAHLEADPLFTRYAEILPASHV